MLHRHSGIAIHIHRGYMGRKRKAKQTSPWDPWYKIDSQNWFKNCDCARGYEQWLYPHLDPLYHMIIYIYSIIYVYIYIYILLPDFYHINFYKWWFLPGRVCACAGMTCYGKGWLNATRRPQLRRRLGRPFRRQENWCSSHLAAFSEWNFPQI